MKVLAVIGSPHENGPSAQLTRAFLQGARDAGHETKEYVLNQMQYKGCQGCGTCKKNGIDCILQDDLRNYWQELHEAGALVVSAPNYAGQVCGPAISYMNRHYCLLDGQWHCRLHTGVKVLGIFSQGNGNPEAYLPQYKWFMADFQNRDMELLDILVHTGKDSPEPGSPLWEKAYALGKNL